MKTTLTPVWTIRRRIPRINLQSLLNSEFNNDCELPDGN
jgi:hypothetical protein